MIYIDKFVGDHSNDKFYKTNILAFIIKLIFKMRRINKDKKKRQRRPLYTFLLSVLQYTETWKYLPLSFYLQQLIFIIIVYLQHIYSLFANVYYLC